MRIDRPRATLLSPSEIAAISHGTPASSSSGQRLTHSERNCRPEHRDRRFGQFGQDVGNRHGVLFQDGRRYDPIPESVGPTGSAVCRKVSPMEFSVPSHCRHAHAPNSSQQTAASASWPWAHSQPARSDGRGATRPGSQTVRRPPHPDRRVRDAHVVPPAEFPQVMLLLLPGSCPRPGKLHSRERSVKASFRGGACL